MKSNRNNRTRNPNIVFFGTSLFAVPSLVAILGNKFTVSAVVTSPDRPAGRKRELSYSPVKKYVLGLPSAKKKKIKLLQPETLDGDFADLLRRLRSDVFLVASYGKILPKEILTIPRLGSLNLHPSLLPKYRGASPIQASVLNGEEETGVTVILMDEKMDHGPILASQKHKISNPENITYAELHDTLASLAGSMVAEVVAAWIKGKIKPEIQSDARATYTKKLVKEDGRVDWKKGALEIDRLVRALNPWPGAFTDVENGNLALKITRARPLLKDTMQKPGTFLEIDGYPAVVCGEGLLKLMAVQPAGGKEMDGREFLLGCRYPPGTVLG